MTTGEQHAKSDPQKAPSSEPPKSEVPASEIDNKNEELQSVVIEQPPPSGVSDIYVIIVYNKLVDYCCDL